MNFRNSLFTTALPLVLLSACSSDQDVTPGSNQNPATDGGADASGVVMQVAYEGQSVTVDLGTLATTSYKGVNLVKLSDVWAGSKLNADRTTLEFEIVGGDGFKPSAKGCADLSGDVLDKGYIDPSSRNLTWDETLGFKGCYSVKNAAQLNAHAPSGDAGGTLDAESTDAVAE